MKTIQDYYLELLSAWGDVPIDEDEVKNILHRLIKEVVASTLQQTKRKGNR